MSSSRQLPRGVTPLTRGTVAVTGPALAWLHRLDAAVVSAAQAWKAQEHQLPPIVKAADLERIDYFRSFPHLMTVPVSLPPDEVAIERFSARCEQSSGTVPLEEHDRVEHALLPAACYVVYPMLGSSRLEGRVLITTKATCYRRESHFVPLRRQWAFTMREVVCVGTEVEVTDLLDRGRALITELCERLDLRRDWAEATDPFFQPSKQGRHLYQRLNPVKHEAVVDDLAIASVNRHHEHFGDAFAVRRGDQAAQSGCVAFGLERWLSVVSVRWGEDPAAWPDPMSAGLDDA
jgi:hypothetical protein